MASECPSATPDLLSGEDPGSPFLEDAIHWMNVYAELLVFRHSLLARADEVLVGAARAATPEVEVDGRFLYEQTERYERRLDFWRHRARELCDKPHG